MPISRRNFLQGAGLAAGTSFIGSAPWIKSSADSSEVDVVVVGAGIAGLITTEKLLQKGRSVVLLEASERVGGRVRTDNRIFGLPYDMGAHWLHNGEVNPLLFHGKEHGFTIYRSPEEEILYVGNRAATESEYETYQQSYDTATRAIAKAGKQGRDVSPASVVPDSGEWTDTVHLNLGPFEIAKDFDRFSCQDWWNTEDGTDYYCLEGFGTLVAHRVRNIPVTLNTPVTLIDWSGAGVVVHTPSGMIRARKCVVTVSTGVLAAGGIVFNPALSAEKQESFEQISMGVYNHLTLQFSRNFFGIGDDGYLTYKIDSHGAASPRGMSMLVNLSGSNLSIGDVGGEFARELEREGERGGIDFALSELRKVFAGEVDRYFVKGHATRWGSDSNYLGSYASAEPGGYRFRRKLRETVADRIFFAGEACHAGEPATVNGAFKTGIKTAKRVHKSLGLPA